MVVVDPFWNQCTFTILSNKVPIVLSKILANWAMTSWCAMLPHNSRSLLLIVPLRLVEETSFDWTDFENSFLQRMGTMVPLSDRINAISPIPGPAASHAPRRAWLLGTNSAIRVGRDARLLSSHRKSSKNYGPPSLIKFEVGWTLHDGKLLAIERISHKHPEWQSTLT